MSDKLHALGVRSKKLLEVTEHYEELDPMAVRWLSRALNKARAFQQKQPAPLIRKEPDEILVMLDNALESLNLMEQDIKHKRQGDSTQKIAVHDFRVMCKLLTKRFLKQEQINPIQLQSPMLRRAA